MAKVWRDIDILYYDPELPTHTIDPKDLDDNLKLEEDKLNLEPEQQLKVMHLYTEGYNMAEISKKTGYPYNRIRKYLGEQRALRPVGSWAKKIKGA